MEQGVMAPGKSAKSPQRGDFFFLRLPPRTVRQIACQGIHRHSLSFCGNAFDVPMIDTTVAKKPETAHVSICSIIRVAPVRITIIDFWAKAVYDA
jgi:hypothetical protein